MSEEKNILEKSLEVDGEYGADQIRLDRDNMKARKRKELKDAGKPEMA